MEHAELPGLVLKGHRLKVKPRGAGALFKSQEHLFYFCSSPPPPPPGCPLTVVSWHWIGTGFIRQLLPVMQPLTVIHRPLTVAGNSAPPPRPAALLRTSADARLRPTTDAHMLSALRRDHPGDAELMDGGMWGVCSVQRDQL